MRHTEFPIQRRCIKPDRILRLRESLEVCGSPQDLSWIVLKDALGLLLTPVGQRNNPPQAAYSRSIADIDMFRTLSLEPYEISEMSIPKLVELVVAHSLELPEPQVWKTEKAPLLVAKKALEDLQGLLICSGAINRDINQDPLRFFSTSRTLPPQVRFSIARSFREKLSPEAARNSGYPRIIQSSLRLSPPEPGSNTTTRTVSILSDVHTFSEHVKNSLRVSTGPGRIYQANLSLVVLSFITIALEPLTRDAPGF